MMIMIKIMTYTALMMINSMMKIHQRQEDSNMYWKRILSPMIRSNQVTTIFCIFNTYSVILLGYRRTKFHNIDNCYEKKIMTKEYNLHQKRILSLVINTSQLTTDLHGFHFPKPLLLSHSCHSLCNLE